MRCKNQDLKKKFNKIENDEEPSHPMNHNQSLLAQIRKFKDEQKSQLDKLKQLTNKKALIDKEREIDLVELEKSLCSAFLCSYQASYAMFFCAHTRASFAEEYIQ